MHEFMGGKEDVYQWRSPNRVSLTAEGGTQSDEKYSIQDQSRNSKIHGWSETEILSKLRRSPFHLFSTTIILPRLADTHLN